MILRSRCQSAPVVGKEERLGIGWYWRLRLKPDGRLVALVDETVGGIDACPEQVPSGHLDLVAIQPSAQAAGQEVVDLLERVVVLAGRMANSNQDEYSKKVGATGFEPVTLRL